MSGPANIGDPRAVGTPEAAEINTARATPRPRLAAALSTQLRTSFFTPGQWREVESLAEVDVLPEPLNFTATRASEILAEAEVLMTGWGCPPLTDPVLDACPRLRAIIHTGGSVRSFAWPAAFSRGIRVSSQTALNAEPVAQYCLAQILLAAKGVGRATRRYAAAHRGRAATDSCGSVSPDGVVDGVDERQRGTHHHLNPHPHPKQSVDAQSPHGPNQVWNGSDGEWDGSDEVWTRPVGVWGSTVGLIGYGRVCRRLIELLRPFGVRILLNSPYVTPAEASTLGVELSTMEQVMTDSDVISIHLGDTDDNHHAITATLLGLIHPGATLINTARGIVVDESALIRELSTGRFDAILDVTSPEPPAPDSPLWTLPNVTLTPHWAGSLGRELTRLGQGALTNLTEYICGQPMTGEIPPDMAQYIA